MKNLEKIDAYLSEDLSPAELLDFEALLEVDTELSRELDLMREIDTALSDTEILDLRAAIAGMMKEEKASSARRRIPRYFRPVLAAAASVAILVASGLLIFNRGQDAESLYKANYETYPSLYNTRSADISHDEAVMAMEPYDLGDYATADANLAALLQRAPERIDFVFYRGICQMELGNYTEAIGFFNQVIASDYLLLHEQSRWYSGLSWLAQGKEAEAKAVFSYLVENNSSFAEKAGKILRSLD